MCKLVARTKNGRRKISWRSAGPRTWFSLASLETVDLELLGLDESALGEPVADLLTLVALELKDLSVLGVLHYGAIAGKLLENTRTSQEMVKQR